MTILNEDGTTPRPWNRENYSELYGGIHRTGIGNDQGIVVFNGLTPLTKEDADLIYNAVNAHDDLLQTAKRAEAFYVERLKEDGGCDHDVNICVCGIKAELEDLRDAIKKAEEKSNA